MGEPESPNRLRIRRSGPGWEPGLVSNREYLISSRLGRPNRSFGKEPAAGGCNRVENSPVRGRGGGSSGGEIGKRRLGCVEGLLLLCLLGG